MTAYHSFHFDSISLRRKSMLMKKKKGECNKEKEKSELMCTYVLCCTKSVDNKKEMQIFHMGNKKSIIEMCVDGKKEI